MRYLLRKIKYWIAMIRIGRTPSRILLAHIRFNGVNPYNHTDTDWTGWDKPASDAETEYLMNSPLYGERLLRAIGRHPDQRWWRRILKRA